ncbi:MAG: hypothetical protein RMY33_024335 [Nostoc sp. DedQUE03]|nr:hypothetical protein [Nostoc sp. DedQUE02]
MSDDKKQSFYAFCKTVLLTAYVQNAQGLNIAAVVDKITDSKH